jgi:acyl dehydratase
MAKPTIIPDIAALESHVDEPLGPTDWLTISQDQINAFADATGDHQWIHVDVERSNLESPFERPIAHGYLTIALIPALLPQLLVVEKVRMVVNYGIDKLRLPSPVPAGGRVRMSALIKSVRKIPGGGARVSIAVTIEVEGGSKPACTAHAIYAYFP